jgi:hypothetical protein
MGFFLAPKEPRPASIGYSSTAPFAHLRPASSWLGIHPQGHPIVVGLPSLLVALPGSYFFGRPAPKVFRCRGTRGRILLGQN